MKQEEKDVANTFLRMIFQDSRDLFFISFQHKSNEKDGSV